MDPTELEREVHRALRSLPPPRAPRSLAPRVMQAVIAASRAPAGWRRWQPVWRVTTLGCAAAVALGLARAWALVTAWIGGMSGVRAAAELWQAFVAPFATPILAATMLLCTLCALLLAALKHVAWEGQETSHT